MPIYSYACPEHGECDILRSFADANEPVACPHCGALMTRVMTVPTLRTLDPAARKARERNEKSAHEPRFQRRHSCGHDHSDGSSCGAHRSGNERQPKQKTNGLKNYTGPRPWVIEHPR